MISAMNPVPRPYHIVLCTCPDNDLAGRIANALVENHHAACVNVLPGIRSTYRWQGKVATDNEVLLMIKTDAGHLAGVEQCIRTLHSYEVPEMIALPISHGHTPYLNWITESLKP
jgi:periplasmic divalent cation tolerance protein